MIFGYEKTPILTLPTPIQKLENMSKLTGCDIYIKRDDMTDFGMGGNKLRKLEYLLFDAKSKGATMLLTYGGAQTNHGRLTAAVAAKYGMKCAILCIDEHPNEISGNILLDRIMGADVYIKKSDGTDENEQNRKFGAEIIAKYEKMGEKVYEIPVGGSNVVGSLGYVDCLMEMKSQLDEMKLEPDMIAVAAGSLGTYIGAWIGAKECGMKADVCGIAISPFGEAKEKRLMEYYGECCEAFGLENSAKRTDFHVETGYVGEGYNSVDAGAREAIYTMARNEAILLDPCYTGKAFAGLLSMIREGKIEKGAKIVFLHTGGSPALNATKHKAAIEAEVTSDGYFLL